MRELFLIILALITLAGCQGKKNINLYEYEQYFTSKDTNILEYVRFSGQDTNIAPYVLHMYESSPKYDLMLNSSKKDSQLIFLSKISYIFTKVENHIFRLDNSPNNSFSIKFAQDSVIFIKSDYGQVNSYSIPATVEIGTSFLDGKISFLRKERLVLNNSEYDCLVVRWISKWNDNVFGPQSFLFDFWLNPKHFIIKAYMIDSHRNQEVFLKDKGT